MKRYRVHELAVVKLSNVAHNVPRFHAEPDPFKKGVLAGIIYQNWCDARELLREAGMLDDLIDITTGERCPVDAFPEVTARLDQMMEGK